MGILKATHCVIFTQPKILITGSLLKTHLNFSVQATLVAVMGRRGDGVHRLFRPRNEGVVDGLEGGGAARQSRVVTGEQASSVGMMIGCREAHWNGETSQILRDKMNCTVS